MLGAAQKALFKTALLRSRAKFKFVINEVPIQQFYSQPYDRWEGYGAERNEVLNFIRSHRIENVVFLTTDVHANLINRVFVDRFADLEAIAQEFITGPVATFTLEEGIQQLPTSIGVDPNTFVQGFNTLLDLEWASTVAIWEACVLWTERVRPTLPTAWSRWKAERQRSP